MSIYTFTTVGSRVKYNKANGDLIASPNNYIRPIQTASGKILITDVSDPIGLHLVVIDPGVDTVIIDATTYSPGGNTVSTVFDAIINAFPSL